MKIDHLSDIELFLTNLIITIISKIKIPLFASLFLAYWLIRVEASIKIKLCNHFKSFSFAFSLALSKRYFFVGRFGGLWNIFFSYLAFKQI